MCYSGYFEVAGSLLTLHRSVASEARYSKKINITTAPPPQQYEPRTPSTASRCLRGVVILGYLKWYLGGDFYLKFLTERLKKTTKLSLF
jgi:hypothetical protein